MSKSPTEAVPLGVKSEIKTEIKVEAPDNFNQFVLNSVKIHEVNCQ